MKQQVAFIVVATLIGVATLAFADEHEAKKPAHSSSRSTTTPSRGPSVLSDEQALAEEKAGESAALEELGKDIEDAQMLLLPEKPLSAATGERSMAAPAHGANVNPNLFSMPR